MKANLILVVGLLLITSLQGSAQETNATTSVTASSLSLTEWMVTSMEMLDDKQKIGPGDRLLYRVIEDEDEPKLLVVTDTGDLQIPYGGLVRAQSKTSKELAKEIKTVLEKELYYQATVIVSLAEINKKRIIGKVYVAGNVRIPGSQDIPADEPYTVGKAIIKAGGFSDFADKRNVRILRSAGALSGEKKTITVNVTDIFGKDTNNKDVPVEPEDMIYVPQRLVNW
jgi:protein involved in polysaccharide export with SLBB domain